MSDEIIPDSQFKPDPVPQDNASPAIGASGGQDFIPDTQFQPDEDKYGTTGQQIITGLEGAAQGVAGPLAPAIEKGLGVEPEDIRLRAETNPMIHASSEAVGFGASALLGTGEAALLGKAGEAVSGALELGSQGASIGSRIAAGATKAATELGLMQSGDEATKAILEDPDQTIGSAAANIGLSTLLGAAGGGLFSGIGAAAKTGLDAIGLKEFSDRIAYRGANLNPNEAIQHEAENAYNAYKSMGDELTGANGVKGQAIGAALPDVSPEATSKIDEQINKINEKLSNAIKESGDNPYLKGSIPKLIYHQNELLEAVTNPNASYVDKFDALNDLKSSFQGLAKYGLNAEDSALGSFAKNFSREIRLGLEDSSVWGGAGDIQKNINSAWSTALPAVKDFEKKFMTRVGNELVLDPAKLNSYMNQNGKATNQTIRQQMMGKFIDAIDEFGKAAGDAYEKAGIANPRAGSEIGMSALKDSLNKPSVGARLADLWYDKLGAQSLGAGAGALAGNAILPGLGGAFIGKEVLGPAFGALIQPILEKTANMSAYQQAMKFGKSVLAGNNQLIKGAASVFEGAKTIPENLYSDHKKVSDLDKRLAELEKNPQQMLNVSGDLGHYAPNHAQSLAKTTMGAVNYLNAQRPRAQQLSPLDSKIEPTQVQKDDFNRTLSIAQNPLTVLQHVKNGTLLPNDVKTLNAIYPKYYQKMSQELMNSMTDHLSKDGTVPYHVRQSCSLFLGQALDSTMTPQAIQSIQSVYAMKKNQPQNPPVTKNKRNTSKLGDLASGLQTQGQKAESRHVSE